MFCAEVSWALAPACPACPESPGYPVDRARAGDATTAPDPERDAWSLVRSCGSSDVGSCLAAALGGAGASRSRRVDLPVEVASEELDDAFGTADAISARLARCLADAITHRAALDASHPGPAPPMGQSVAPAARTGPYASSAVRCTPVP
jgi:hypothetical protein